DLPLQLGDLRGKPRHVLVGARTQGGGGGADVLLGQRLDGGGFLRAEFAAENKENSITHRRRIRLDRQGQRLRQVQALAARTKRQKLGQGALVDVRNGVEQLSEIAADNDRLRKALGEHGKLPEGGETLPLAKLERVGRELGQPDRKILRDFQPGKILQQLIVLFRRHLRLLHHFPEG